MVTQKLNSTLIRNIKCPYFCHFCGRSNIRGYIYIPLLALVSSGVVIQALAVVLATILPGLTGIVHNTVVDTAG